MSHENDGVCRKEIAPDAPPLFQNGNINFQVYHIGWIISATLALVAVIASFWLINKHLRHYTNKREQRYIVRLLFLVPLYAVISLGSFIFWNHATPLILIRDAYEATVLTAFFYLLLMYISHDAEEQKKAFLKAGLSKEADARARRKGQKIRKWMFPLGFVKWKPKDGLYFLQLMKWGVLQYCVVRPTTTLAAVILEYMGLYCERSWGLGWGHIYIVIIISISVSIAMYCLIQLYLPVSKELERHKPLLKLFAVKAVVFLTFWQATFLSLLTMFGVVKNTKYMTAEDVNVGIGALLEDFEMMLFAFLHIRAFTYKPYRLPDDSNGLPLPKTPRWRSLGHAMDFRETFREIWTGCIYLYDKLRGREPKLDLVARRAAHYELAFGRERLLQGQEQLDQGSKRVEKTKPSTVEIEVDRTVEIEGERQWLGLGKYGGNRPRREASEGLQDQIDRELTRLGHRRLQRERELPPLPSSPLSRSPSHSIPWWRSLYNRISHSGNEDEDHLSSESVLRRGTRKRRPSRYVPFTFPDDLPPSNDLQRNAGGPPPDADFADAPLLTQYTDPFNQPLPSSYRRVSDWRQQQLRPHPHPQSLRSDDVPQIPGNVPRTPLYESRLRESNIPELSYVGPSIAIPSGGVERHRSSRAIVEGAAPIIDSFSPPPPSSLSSHRREPAAQTDHIP